MKYMIRKSTELFTGYPYGEHGHPGSVSDAVLDCARAGIIPGKIYNDIDQAITDNAKLCKNNPRGFEIKELSESAIALQKFLPVLRAIVSNPDFEKAMSELDITAEPLFKEAFQALKSEGIDIIP